MICISERGVLPATNVRQVHVLKPWGFKEPVSVLHDPGHRVIVIALRIVREALSDLSTAEAVKFKS